MVIKEVEYNDEDAQALIQAEETFWNEYVVPKKMPPVDGSKSCAEAIKKRFPGGDEEACELDEIVDQMLKDRERYKGEIKKLEETVTKIENQLKLTMENKEFGRSSTYNVWYKTRNKTGFNSNAFAKDHPALYEKYKTSSPYRALLIKISKARAKED